MSFLSLFFWCQSAIAQGDSFVTSAAPKPRLWPALGPLSRKSTMGENDVAMIVSIGDYLYITDIPGGKKSGQAWRNWLVQGRGIPEKNIFYFEDGQAKRKDLIKTWKKAVKTVKKGGTLWFIFTGHGSSHKEKSFLMPVDTPLKSNGPKKQAWLWSDIVKQMKKGKQTNSIAFVEACFNGKTPAGDKLNVPAVAPKASSMVADDLTLMLANSPGECPGMIQRLPQLPASYLAIGALRGWGDADRDGKVTPREVIGYVNKAFSFADPARSQSARLLGKGVLSTISVNKEKGPDLEMINLVLYPKRRERRGPSFLPWEMVQGITDFDNIMATLKDRREMAITFEAERSEKATALQERATKHWNQIESFADQAVDDFSRMAAYSFLNKYKDVNVKIQDRKLQVKIPQLEEAENMILGMEVPELAEKSDYAFAWIPNGSFVMGSPLEEVDRNEEERQHPVRITRSFYMSNTEVTQALYTKIMGKNPSANVGTTLPVNQVSWFDAVRFANRISLKEGLETCYVIQGDNVRWPKGTACEGYRLPTESEWEYAARANVAGVYAGGNDLDRLGWYENNSSGQVQPVASKKPNEWGLYDMSGNVWEWIWDGYAGYPNEEAIDPMGEDASAFRIRRGGSVGHLERYARVAYRVRVDPYFKSYDIGFRLVRTAVMPIE